MHQLKKCQFCGAELPEEASFCLKCSSVINTREVYESNSKKAFLAYKKAATVSLLIILTFSLCFLSSASIKTLPTISDDSAESETTLIPVTLPNGEEVTDDSGNTVYEAVTVEPTTKKPSLLSEIISSITGKDDDKDSKNKDNDISEDKPDIINSDISQKPSSTEQNRDKNPESSSSDNNNSSTSPSQEQTSQSPTETEPTTEEETDVYEDPSEVFEYKNYNKDGTQISITKYKGNASFVTVPDFIDGKMVAEIETNAFKDNSKIKTIDIPKGNRTDIWLRDSCFNNLSSLTTVNLYDNNLGTFGRFAVDCPIKDINVTYWQFKFVDGALYQYNSRNWKFSYFAGNPCYSTLNIPSWCTEIDYGNLKTAKNLKVINAHKDVTSIPTSDFDYGKNLEAINIEEGNFRYFSKDGVLFYKTYNSTGYTTNYEAIYPHGKKDKSFTLPQKDGYTFRIPFYSNVESNPYVEEFYIPLNASISSIVNPAPSFPNLKKLHYAKGNPQYDEIRFKFTGEVTLY